MQVGELVGACRSSEFTDMIVVQETRGEPDGLIVCHLPLGPTAFFTLSNCVLRHDIADRGTVSEVYPHLILDKFTTSLGQRVADVLKYLFPVPKACICYVSKLFVRWFHTARGFACAVARALWSHFTVGLVLDGVVTLLECAPSSLPVSQLLALGVSTIRHFQKPRTCTRFRLFHRVCSTKLLYPQ